MKALLLCLMVGLAATGATAAQEMKILIHKKERRLELWEEGGIVASFAIGLGSFPVGHKQREGDGRTPEGIYRICVKNPRSRFYLSLGIDYPGPQDALAGYNNRRISAEERDAIFKAHRDGTAPPWNTALGGEIFIHGMGAGRDWTRGCVALNNRDMKFLYDKVPAGTLVQILP